MRGLRGSEEETERGRGRQDRATPMRRLVVGECTSAPAPLPGALRASKDAEKVVWRCVAPSPSLPIPLPFPLPHPDPPFLPLLQELARRSFRRTSRRTRPVLLFASLCNSFGKARAGPRCPLCCQRPTRIPVCLRWTKSSFECTARVGSSRPVSSHTFPSSCCTRSASSWHPGWRNHVYPGTYSAFSRVCDCIRGKRTARSGPGQR